MDPSPQPQVTLPHDDNEVTESRGVVIELESESGSCIVDNIGHDSDTDVNSLSDFDEFDDEEDDPGIQFRDIGEIRLISVEPGSDDGDPEDEREIWGIDLNEEDVYADESDVSVTIHSLQVEDSAVEFDWEEVDGGGGGGEREILSGFAEANISLEDLARDERRDDGSGNLEWQVLMNSHTLEINFDVENRELHIVGGDHEDYIHAAEYDLLFEQFAQAGITNLRFPPTSESFIKNLPVVVQLSVENGDCAVCKDEMSIGGSEAAVLLLPCNHKYHGECIVPWLETRNTCPVCRYELPTDDVDYERRKSHIRR